MAIGIEIALDPSQAVRGADQVDKALDGIADSADKASKFHFLPLLNNTYMASAGVRMHFIRRLCVSVCSAAFIVR